jgi:hypothetical protein
MHNLFDLLLQNGIQVSKTFSPKQIRRRPRLARSAIDSADTVIINGEGTFHDSQPACITLLELAAYAKRQGLLVYLINTVWQNNSEIESYLASVDQIYARDSRSAKELSSCHPRVEVVPDLSFATADLHVLSSVSESGRPLVVDSVYHDRSLELAAYARRQGLRFKLMGISYPYKRILKQFVRPAYTGRLVNLGDIIQAEYIISGRFHAITLACCFSVPFICVPSNSYKIEALLEDMGLAEETYLCSPSCMDQIDVHLAKMRVAWMDGDQSIVNAFVNRSDWKIRRMFQSIRAELDTHVGISS